MSAAARRLGAFAVAAVAVSLLAGCGARPQPGGPPPSGTSSSSTSSTASTALGRIHIVAVRAPTCPVERAEGPPCVAPYQGPLQVIDAANTVVAAVTTSAGGMADVMLPAGRYTVTAAPTASGLPRLTQPATVTVAAGQTVIASLSFDTGIR